MKFSKPFLLALATVTLISACNSNPGAPTTTSNSLQTNPNDQTLANHETPTIDDQPNHTRSRGRRGPQNRTYEIYSKLEWNTAGGGDLHYSIILKDKGYLVTVTKANFKDTRVSYLISKRRSETYQKLKGIFTGKTTISEGVVSNLPTGTGDTLTLTTAEGNTVEIKSPVIETVSDQTLFQDLRETIEKRLSTSQTCKDITSMVGNWKSHITQGTGSIDRDIKIIAPPTMEGMVDTYLSEITTKNIGCFNDLITNETDQLVFDRNECTLSEIKADKTVLRSKIVNVTVHDQKTKFTLAPCADDACSEIKNEDIEVSTWKSVPDSKN